MKNEKIGAKKGKITEKRHFPMDFSHKTFNYSIPPIHQQIRNIQNGVKRGKKIAKKLNSPPTSRKPT
jgi:hypothetical protein